MEILLIVLGLIIIYTWVHSIVLCFKHIKKVSTYEKVVLLSGLTGFILYTIGTLS